MDSEEWALWQDANRRTGSQARVERPCEECPLGFALAMRAEGRCNGEPAGAPEDEEDEVMVSISEVKRKPVKVAIEAPCPGCSHREVCGIRQELEGVAGDEVSVGLPDLPPALTPTLTIAVDCAFFVKDKAVKLDGSARKARMSPSASAGASNLAKYNAERAAAKATERAGN